MIGLKIQSKHIYICFPNGKNKALTMSYDDGMRDDIRLIDIFNRNGIKGTFNLNSGSKEKYAVDIEKIKEIYAGHEIASHTYTHPNMVRIPKSQIIQQIMLDRYILEQHCGYPVRGMALPYGTSNREIIDLLGGCGIEYCRTTGSTDSFSVPDDFMNWKPTCKHNHKLMENAKRLIESNNSEKLYLMSVWGHSFEFDRSLGVDWEKIQEFCEFIGGRDDIWYATNIEIVSYMDAANKLKYTADCSRVLNMSSTCVWVKANEIIQEILPGQIIDI